MPLDNDWLMGDPIYPCALCDLTPFVNHWQALWEAREK